MAGKKIVQVNVTLNSGSTGRITEDISKMLIQHGYSSYIAYGRSKNTSTSQTIRIGNNAGIRMHGLKTRLFDAHGFGSGRATSKLIEQIRAIQPDLIHLHNLHGYYINVEVLFNFLKLQAIPVVWTLHDCWAFTGHCAYYSAAGCNKWLTECNHCPQKTKYPASFLLDNSKNNYYKKRTLFTGLNHLTIVTVSRWMETEIKKSFLQKYTVKVIHNGIDINAFRPLTGEAFRASYDVMDKYILLGVANIWTHRKGFQDFLLLSSLIDNDSIIVLVGLTRKQIHGLPSNIIGIERTESIEALAELYSAADVFVNPSIEESFGLVTAEAIACGTPAVVYNATACPEVIDESCGYVVEKGNVVSVWETVKKIRANGKNYYSSKCRERALKFFNKDERYGEYINLYENLSSRRP